MVAHQQSNSGDSHSDAYMKEWLHEKTLWKVDSCRSNGTDPTASSTSSSPFTGCMTSLFSCEASKMGHLLAGVKRIPAVIKGGSSTDTEEEPPNGTKYHSPETLKQKPDTPPSSITNTSLFQTPKKVMEKLSRRQRVGDATPPKKCDSKRGYLVLPDNNDDVFSCPQWLECQYPQVEGRQQPEMALPAALTLDMLKNHEITVKKGEGVPTFSGDKLAKSVIHSKSQRELARERKARIKQELESQSTSQEKLRTSTTTASSAAQAEWLTQERQKALAAKWRRKKYEQREQLRIEQLRLAELERQREMRLVGQRGLVKSTLVEI